MVRAFVAGHHIGTITLAPILLAQGIRVRKRVQKLPEPPGNRSGVDGQGRSLKLLVLGDSAAAGVGAGHQSDALTGQLVKNLSDRFEVDWTLFAKTGATTASSLQRVNELQEQRFDVVVTSLGVNDVTSGITAKRWLELSAELRIELRRRFAVKRFIINGLPPMRHFPALPQPLRWHLGSRAMLFDRLICDQIKSESDCSFLSIDFGDDLSLMASDGFHPGPKAYSIWGDMVANAISNDSIDK